MVNIYPPIKLQKTDTPKSISNIGKSWKDLFAYPFFALTRLHLKTENNKLNINGYTQYLMKSTFENIWLFSQAVISYACVQFYTHRALDYHLGSQTVNRGKNKNLTALKSNSNTVWFNFQTYIYIYIYIYWNFEKGLTSHYICNKGGVFQ